MIKTLTILIFFLCTSTRAQNTPGFVKEIPRYADGRPSVFYKLIREYEISLGLDTIENGFDSLEIRIWYHYPKFRPPGKILIVKRVNMQWEAQLYSHEEDSIRDIKTKTDVRKAVGHLFENKLLSLPNMHDIKGLEDDIADGSSYTVEISDKKHYRIYHYHEPEEFKKKFKEARYFIKILKIADSEFHVNPKNWD